MGELYHVVQAIDEWSIIFATLGSRSTGQSGGQFAFVLEGDSAQIGQAQRRWPSATLVSAPTRIVWLFMRIQSNDHDRFDEIADPQARFRLLSDHHAPEPPPLPSAMADALSVERFNLSAASPLEVDEDGRLIVSLSAMRPGIGTQNWLPIPEGRFSVCFRAYWPTEAIGAGGDEWHLPPVVDATD
jgi:hypothetical protein